MLGVDISSIFQALQASLGGYYVNDLNLFGRTWQVQVQGESEDRTSVDDIYRINVRNAKGEMIPLRSLVEMRVVVGPQALIRYNNRLAVTVQGSPAPGVSSGQALAAMDAVAAGTLPPRVSRHLDRYFVSGETGRGQDGAYSRVRDFVRVSVPGGAVRKLDHPGSVLMSVSVGVAGAFLGIVAFGLTLDLYAQIGMVVLIGSPRRTAS